MGLDDDTMKKQLLLALLIASICFSAASDNITAQVTNAQSSSSMELIKDWRVICVLLLLISVILVAAAYMAGQAFDIPELKGWASLEISQVIASAILIVVLFVALAFIDTLMIGLVQESGITQIKCLPTDNCALKITDEYFSGMEDAMDTEVKVLLQDAVDAGEKLGRRSGESGHTLLYPVPTLWESFSMAWAPQNILHLERYNTVLEFYSTLYSSMYAQQFFMKSIVPVAAPILLILGLVARSFFVTRRLGGLLIAIALGVMVVFPLMYVFDWITLKITLYGDKALSPEPAPVCPAACQTLPPAAYNKQTGDAFYTASSLAANMESKLGKSGCKDQGGDDISWGEAFLTANNLYKPETFVSKAATQQEKDKMIASYGQAASADDLCTMQFITQASVESSANNQYFFCLEVSEGTTTFSGSKLPYGLDQQYKEQVVCPIACRELPYPFGKSECNPLAVQWACNKLPEQCKVKRTIQKSTIDDLSTKYKEKIEKCLPQCRMTPAMKSDCASGTGEATQGYVDIKDTYITKGQCSDILPANFFKDQATLSDDEKKGISIAQQFCEKKYSDKGAFMYAFGTSWGGIPGGDTGCYDIKCYFAKDECLAVSPECRMRMENVEQDGLDKDWVAEGCNDQVLECPASLNPSESCVYVVPNEKYWEQCSECLLIDDGFQFDPPIASDCMQLCTDTNWDKTKLSPAQFAVQTREGMVGTSEIKNAASFVVPLYILPLLNILVTLMFIKTFSQMLGGDIEIPGLQKVF